MTSFKDLALCSAIQETLDQLGFVEPTEIQRKAIPVLLEAQKIDFHGQAQTGTGKTLAFGLPLLNRIDKSIKQPQALVVAPTRELSLQICESLKPFAQALGLYVEPIFGGMSLEAQVRTLKRGVHIVVGTPGRLNDLARRGSLNLDMVKTLVLDEADIMLDMGFKEEVDEILTEVPESRDIWLFSATVKGGIDQIKRDHMHDVVTVSVSKQNVGTHTTKQYYCMVPARARLTALCRFIESFPEFYAFIFCQTKILTSEVAERLVQRGFNVGALHGDMSQAQRNAIIKKFRDKEITIVVATDVAARGIDIANLTHVINYSLPEDLESYVHRVGRTGRAGKEGTAISFIGRNESHSVKMLQRKFSIAIEPIDVPSRNQIVEGRLGQAKDYIMQLATQPVSMDEHIHARIAELVSALTPEQERCVLERFVYDRFLAVIAQEKDDLFVPASKVGATGLKAQPELMMAVGSDDNVTEDDIRELLTTKGGITADDILKVRIIKRRSFIEITPSTVATVLESVRNESLGGRKIRLALVEDEGGDRRREGRGGERRSFGGRGRGEGRDGERRSFGGRSRSFDGESRGEGRSEGRGFSGGRERDGGRNRSEGRDGERRSFGGRSRSFDGESRGEGRSEGRGFGGNRERRPYARRERE